MMVQVIQAQVIQVRVWKSEIIFFGKNANIRI